MDKIKITSRCTTDGYWLNYIKSDGQLRQINLGSCANSFKLATGGRFSSDDDLTPVGWRYEANDCLYYELFCVGHVQLYYPLQPNFLEKLVYALTGQDPLGSHLLKIESFEQILNESGWKTVPRPKDF